jgi:hypothetical protein
MFGSQSPRLSAPPVYVSVNSVPSALKSSPKRNSKLRPIADNPTRSLFFHNQKAFRAHQHRPTSFPPCLTSRFAVRAGAAIDCDPAAPPFRHTPINHLEATLTNSAAKADSKPLTQNLNPLDATLTKIEGGRTSSQRHHYSPLTTHSPNHSATLCLRGTL